MQHAHGQGRRRVAAQRDMLLQTQDAGGPRGRFAFNSSGTGNAERRRVDAASIANSLASFLLDWPNTVQRDLKVFDDPGTQAHGRCSRSSQDKWQVALERHRRPRTALGVLHAARRASKERAACPTTIRPPTRCASSGYGDTDEALNVKKNFKQLRAAHRRVLAPQREERRPRGLRRQHDSVPGQPLRVQLPGEADLRRDRRSNGFQPAGSMAAGFPAAGAARHSVERHHPGQRRAAERDVRRHPERRCTRARCTRGTSPTSASCRTC